jgi:hypothetical protein
MGETTMRTARRLLRGILATTVGLTLAVPATAAPARASVADYQGYVTIIVTAFGMGDDGVLTPQELNALVGQVIGVIQGTKSDVITRLDDELTNEILGITEASLNKVELLRVPWLAGPAINGIGDAAFLAKAHLRTVRGADLALDAVGRAMIALFNELHAVYLVVDNDEGTNLAPGVLPPFREGLEYLVREMAPECTSHHDPRTGQRAYDCTFGGRTVHAEYFPLTHTYTIDGGDPIPGQIDPSIVQEIVMRDTVWQVARETLEALVREGVLLP